MTPASAFVFFVLLYRRPGRAGDVVKVKRLFPDLDRWQG